MPCSRSASRAERGQCFRPLGKVGRKETKARRPQKHTLRQEREIAFPHWHPSPAPLCPGHSCPGGCPHLHPSPSPPLGLGVFGGVGGTLGPCARCPPTGRAAAGCLDPGERGDNEKGDGRGRSRSQAHGKFIVRGKHFQPSFTMTPAGSFLHNLVYFERKQQRRNPLPPPRGTGGSPDSPFPGLSLQAT